MFYIDFDVIGSVYGELFMLVILGLVNKIKEK